MSIREELILNTNFKVESAILPMKRLLEMDSPPDAIFGANDQVAIGAMRVVKDKGLKIPQDVGLVGFDKFTYFCVHFSFTHYCEPPRQENRHGSFQTIFNPSERIW